MAMRKIAVMVAQGSGHTSGVMRGIAQYAVAHGPWEFTVQFPGLSLMAIREWKVDGVIVPVRSGEYSHVLRGRAFKVVNCSGMLKDAGVPTVRVNDAAVGRLAAEHLLERGFRQFGFVGFEPYDFSAARRESFAEAVRGAGGEFHPYEPDPALATEWTWERQEADLARWLGRLPKPAGVFAANDDRAWHVAEACRRIGLRSPEEVAILGVDNDDLRCEFSCPPLSSVAVPAERIGYEAAALLDRLMKGEPEPAGPVFIEPQGVAMRRSTDTLAVSDDDVRQAFRYIREHAGEPLKAVGVAEAVGVSVPTLARKFRDLLGRTLKEELQRTHLRRAERILAETDLALPKVAHAAGFKAPSRFHTLLRRETGLTPRAYREKFRMR